MKTDVELLSQYAAEQSEAAFAELVQRHVDLIYSAAARLSGGDTHRAEDVTQQVFAELARQAQTLRRHPTLVGWLYTTDEECRRTLALLRAKGEQIFSRMTTAALQRFAQANNGGFPDEISQLKPYFSPPVDEAVLERYHIVPVASLDPMAPAVGDRVITQKAPINQELDSRLAIGPRGAVPLSDRPKWD